MVIFARNPVHSVLFLILCLLQRGGLFVLMGAEFLAMILVVVYVGAVAVLFLFVVMMLDINFAALREGFLKYLPVGAPSALVLLAELIDGASAAGTDGAFSAGGPRRSPIPIPRIRPDPQHPRLGRVIYTQLRLRLPGRRAWSCWSR